MTLKTLKDLEYLPNVIVTSHVRAEAIKWVKKDLSEQYTYPLSNKPSPFLERWMKRLNISEEDLK